MASHRVVLPLSKPGGCTVRKFSDEYLPILSQHVNAFDWSASIARINQANQPNTGPRIAVIVSLIGFIFGFNAMLSAGSESDDSDNYSPMPGFWLTIFSVVVMSIGARRMRTSHIQNVTNAVLAEHQLYSLRSPQVCWRINHPATRISTLEVDLLHPLISTHVIPQSNQQVPQSSTVVEMHQYPAYEQHQQAAAHQAQMASQSNQPRSQVSYSASAYPVVSPPSYTLPVAVPVQQDHTLYMNNGQLMRQPLVINQY